MAPALVEPALPEDLNTRFCEAEEAAFENLRLMPNAC